METPPPPTPRPAKMNWPLFNALLLAPATLSFLAIACNFGGTVVFLTIHGSLVASLACAMIYSNSRDGSTASRVLTFFLLWPLLTVVSFGLCWAGCALGGMKGI